MQGNLRDMAIADLIQHNCEDRKTAQLKIEHSGQEAILYFMDGNVTHAVLGNQTGEEVVYQILHWEDGLFDLKTGVKPPKKTITRNWSGILMEGARRIDEKEVEEGPLKNDQDIHPEDKGMAKLGDMLSRRANFNEFEQMSNERKDKELKEKELKEKELKEKELKDKELKVKELKDKELKEKELKEKELKEKELREKEYKDKETKDKEIPVLDGILKEMSGEITGYVACALVGMDGLNIASHTSNKDANPDAISAQLTLLLKLVDTTVGKLGAGVIEDNLTTTESSFILMRYLPGKQYYLGMAANRKTGNLGNLRLISKLYTQRLSQAMPR